MKKERKEIQVTSLRLNEGQLEWLPKNPRKWSHEDLVLTKASILEDPDFLEERPILVVPFGPGSFIVFAGNLRTEGCKEAKCGKVPCVIHYPETEADFETIKRRAMKDNGTFGQTDWDEVFSSEWGTMPLDKWGLTPKGWAEKGKEDEAGSPDDYGSEFSLPDGEGPASNQITFYLAPEQKSFINDVLAEVDEGEDNFGNESKQGNKLYQVVKQWAESRT